MPTYLVRRAATYYFRRVIPKKLRPIIGQSQFMWSLKTTNLAEAKKLCNRDAVATDGIIEAAIEGIRSAPQAEPAAWPADLDEAAIQMMAAKIAVPLRRSLQAAAEQGGGKLEAKRREYADTLRAHEDNLYEGWLIDQVPLSQSEAYALAFRSVLTPHSAKPLPPIPAKDGKADSGAKETLDDIRKLWAAERPISRTTKMWETTVTAFTDFNGDKPIREVTKQEIIKFIDHLSYTGLKHETLKSRLNQLKSLFGFAARRDLIPGDPTTGLKAPGKPSEEKPREPWSTEALNSLFASPLYSSGDLQDGAKSAAGYFLPVLGLFTGARLNELGQLRPDDVFEEAYSDESGQRQSRWVIRLVADKEAGLTLKNKSAARRFPVHAELERLGFIKLVLTAKASGQARIFSELSIDRYGKCTSAWGKWFGRYIRKTCGIDDPKITFHSFRHTFKDTCRALDLKEDVQDAITGHSNGSVSRGYGYRSFPLNPMVNLINSYVLHDVSLPDPYAF